MNDVNIVNEITNYIEINLTEELNLDKIAHATNYSKYYIHRLFRETVGVTIKDYIIRRRLTNAAKFLIFSNKKVLEIALKSGYKSQQSFSAAFKEMYKITPIEFRKRESFYPLQMQYKFDEVKKCKRKIKENTNYKIKIPTKMDICKWMELVNLVIDGFPNLIEDEYIETLECSIENKSSFMMTDDNNLVGIMMINRNNGNIDFMATHPLYKNKNIAAIMLDFILRELFLHDYITTITFREGDKADTGYRKELINLGFAEAELITELNYPVQKMILKNKKE